MTGNGRSRHGRGRRWPGQLPNVLETAHASLDGRVLDPFGARGVAKRALAPRSSERMQGFQHMEYQSALGYPSAARHARFPALHAPPWSRAASVPAKAMAPAGPVGGRNGSARPKMRQSGRRQNRSSLRVQVHQAQRTLRLATTAQSRLRRPRRYSTGLGTLVPPRPGGLAVARGRLLGQPNAAVHRPSPGPPVRFARHAGRSMIQTCDGDQGLINWKGGPPDPLCRLAMTRPRSITLIAQASFRATGVS